MTWTVCKSYSQKTKFGQKSKKLFVFAKILFFWPSFESQTRDGQSRAIKMRIFA